MRPGIGEDDVRLSQLIQKGKQKKSLKSREYVAAAVLAIGCSKQPATASAALEVEPDNYERQIALDGQPNFGDFGGHETVEDYGSMEAYSRDRLGISNERVGQLRNELME